MGYATGEPELSKFKSGITENQAPQETKNLGELFREALKNQPTQKQKKRQHTPRMRNTNSGIRFLHIVKCSSCKQGFTWRYTMTANGNRVVIQSVDLLTVKRRVKEEGHPWIVYNTALARQTARKAQITYLELESI